jgi:iron complex outermembrane receptor protein
VVFTGSRPFNVIGRVVQGNLTSSQALATLLAGTGITYRFTNARTVTIDTGEQGGAVRGGSVPAGAIPLDTIDVQGETAWGPVQGFVASRSATGSKTDTPIIEVPQSISVVTRDQIETRQAVTIDETLKYTPGVLTGAPQSSDTRVLIRGFEVMDSYSVSLGGMYLNGLRTFNGAYDPYGLERVEVMRGPASVLYGQGHPGGTISLVTKRPTEEPFHEIMLQGGSFDRKVGAFDFSGPANEDKTLLYRFTGLVRDANSQVDFSKDDRVFLSGAMTWRPTDATNIMFYGNYQKDVYRWNFGLPAEGTVLPNPNGRIPLTRFIGEPSSAPNTNIQTSIGYNAEHRTDVGWTFRQNFRYDYGNKTLNEVSTSGLMADLRTLDRILSYNPRIQHAVSVDNQAELEATTGILKHTVLAGLDYRRGTYRDYGTWDSAPPLDIFAPVYGQPLVYSPIAWDTTTSLKQTGLYLQDQIKLDRWILTLGGRHDWATSKLREVFSNTNTEQRDQAFTKRAGLGYEFDIGLVPYIGYSESFTPLDGATFEGTPFRPETGKLHEAGIKFQPKGTNMRLTAAVFDLRRQNVLTPDLPLHPFHSRQIGEVTSRGFEFEAVASLTNNLNLTAAYAYTDARVTGSTDADLGKRPPQVPQHMASLWADYTIREGALNGLGFGGGVRYVGSSAGDFLNTFEAPAYTLVDAMIRYEIDNWRFAINATNLFDKYYVAYCYTMCGIGRTRTILGTVSYRW